MTDDPMPHPLSPASGVSEPRLIRGDIPEPGRQIRKKKRSPWERHIALAREFPARWDPAEREWKGGWVEVGVYMRKGDGPKARRKARDLDHRRLQMHLWNRFPLDRFQIAQRCDPGTFCDLRMYMRYLRTLTPEEDRIDRIERHRRYEAMMARRAQVKARRELERRREERGQG